MILKIETEIFGFFTIENNIVVKIHPYEVSIRSDQENLKYLVSISKREPKYLDYIPIPKMVDGKIEEIKLPTQEFLQEQIQILQHIESFGAIDKNIEKIDWQNCSIEWIPETLEEGKQLAIRSYNRKLEYKPDKQLISQEWLFQTLVHRRQLQHLDLPFSFYREGINFFFNFQYQNSYVNLYLMLEGFFSNGNQYKNEKIKKDFKKSEILNYAINETIKYLSKNKDKHYIWILQKCKDYNKNLDVDAVIHLLVENRGALSHFSLASSRKQKNTFFDRDYESLAFITLMICRYSTNKLRLEPFKKNSLNR